MCLINRCAVAIAPLLQRAQVRSPSHEDALEVVRRVFEEAQDVPTEVLLAMCEFECERKSCRAAGACQRHYLRHHKQRWEMAISTILAGEIDE